MERADSADTTFGILAISIAECFGSESVSPELASSLKRVLPEATFLRATVRCGSGLFVTDDLFRPGYSMVSLVSLKYSLAGLAMKQGRPLTVRLPAGSSSFGTAAPTRIVACAPISIESPPGANYAPLQIGALLVGSTGDLSVNLKAGLSRLAGIAGPSLLTIGLSRVQHLSHLLSLREADADYIGLEEDLQDLPIEVARPHQSEFGPPTQPLDLGSGIHSEELEAVAAAAAIAAAAVVEGGNRKANVLYNVDEGVEVAEEIHPVKFKASNGHINHNGSSFSDVKKDSEDMDTSSQFFLGNGSSKGMESMGDISVSGKGNADEDDTVGFHKRNNSKAGNFHVNGTTSLCSSLGATATYTITAAAAAAAVPLGPFLSYQESPSMEAAFIATEARIYAASDAAFCLLYIITLCCSVWASSTSTDDLVSSQLPSWLACILAFTAAMPLVASLSSLINVKTSESDTFYIRFRETFLLLLMLVPIVMHRHDNGGSLLDMSAASDSWPCLQRSADVTMAFFMPLGCRIRFCWLLPAQILNLASIFVGMPWLQLQATGCGATCAALVGCTGILPLVLTYRCETKARQHLAALFMAARSGTVADVSLS